MTQTRSRFHVPVIEHKGHSPKWRLLGREYPLPPGVEWLVFTQDRGCHWWFKLGRRMRVGRNDFVTESAWMPVPGYGFELPPQARLQRVTAVPPSMTPAEWGRTYEENRRTA